MPNSPMYLTLANVYSQSAHGIDSQQIGGDNTIALPSTPLTQREKAIAGVVGELAFEMSLLSSLTALTILSEGSATPMTAARMGISAGEIYSLIQKATQMGVLAAAPERDIGKIQEAFGFLSLTGRATKAGLHIFESNLTLSKRVGPVTNEKIKLLEASIGLLEAGIALRDAPQSPKTWTDLQKASDELFNSWNQFVEKHLLDKEETAINNDDAPFLGVRLLDNYGLPEPYDIRRDAMFDTPRTPKNDDFSEPDNDSKFDRWSNRP